MSLSISLPRNHAARIATLKQAFNTASAETEKPYLTGITTELSQLIPQYEGALLAFQESSGRVNQARDASNPTLKRLQLVVRAGWRGLRLRQKVEQQSLEVFDSVGLHRRLNPKLLRNQSWVDWANKLLAGEEALIAKGYPAMTNPAMTTVAEALDGAQAAIILLDQELVNMKKRRKLLNQMAERGHMLLRRAALSLRQTLIEEKASARRDVMRRFGFTFKNRTAVKANGQEPRMEQEPEPGTETALDPAAIATEPEAGGDRPETAYSDGDPDALPPPLSNPAIPARAPTNDTDLNVQIFPVSTLHSGKPPSPHQSGTDGRAGKR